MMVMNKKLFVIGIFLLLLGIILCVFKFFIGILFAICSYFVVYFSFPKTEVSKSKRDLLLDIDDTDEKEVTKKVVNRNTNTRKNTVKKVNKVKIIEAEPAIKEVEPIVEENVDIPKETIKTVKIVKEVKKDKEEKEVKVVKEEKSLDIKEDKSNTNDNKKEENINRTYSVNNKVINDSVKFNINDVIMSLSGDEKDLTVPGTTISKKDTLRVDEDIMDNLVLSLDDALDKPVEQYEKYVKVRFLGYNKVYTYLSNPLKKLNTGDYVTVASKTGEEKIVYVVEGDKLLPKKYDMEYKMIQFPKYQFNNNTEYQYNYNNMV